MILAFIFLIAGFVLLIKGADVFVEATSKIATMFHIPQIVIGLTIVAMGTSLPEAAISITATYSGASGITVGNIVGSNILNVLLILGICASINELKVSRNTYRFEIPFVAVISLILMGLGYLGNSISKTDGLILSALFVSFLGYLMWLTKKGEDTSLDDVEELDPNDTLLKLVVFVVLGIVGIVLGSNLTVTGATEIATRFGISDRIIGLTIVAFGTSLPELITSVTAVLKGKNDIAIGNIVGSDIFNILFVLGISGIVAPAPIPYSAAFITDTIVATLSIVLLYVLCNKDLKIKRYGGTIMLISFAFYYFNLLVK